MNAEQQTVINALQDIVSHPEHDEQRIAAFFSADYQQYVDGEHLDYPGFLQHMKVLKSVTSKMTVTVLAIASEENTVFTHHQVSVEKPDGQHSDVEVMARFTLESGLIVRCDELTRLIRGEQGDQDLGSRR